MVSVSPYFLIQAQGSVHRSGFGSRNSLQYSQLDDQWCQTNEITEYNICCASVNTRLAFSSAMKTKLTLLSTMAIIALLSSTSIAYAATTALPMVGQQWAVYTTHGTTHADTIAAGVQFQFSDATSSKPAYDTLMLNTYTTSLTATNILTATINVVTSASGGSPVSFVGNPNGGCPIGTCPGAVRLYFHANLPVKQAGNPSCAGGGYNVNDYWWADVGSYTFVPGSATSVTLSATLNPANWSNLCGQSGTDTSANFAAALTKVNSFGLSFGSGSHFENGVGVDGTTGTATFQLLSYTIA
jgi:hypothetical protein